MNASVLPAAQHTRVAVRCERVTKTFGTGESAVQALRGVDLEVRRGELLMLVGPSGCGKTTLISIIAGVLRRDGGRCVVYDQEYDWMNEEEITSFRGQQIGFVFQALNLIPSLTTAENVAAPLIINGMRLRPAEKRAREVLAEVGFDDRLMRSYPTDISGGQQQRVAIARALVHHPKLIVCDEPTSALDGETGRKVMQLLQKLGGAEDRTLIVVTHDSRIFEFADRIAQMEDGCVSEVVASPEYLKHAPVSFA